MMASANSIRGKGIMHRFLHSFIVFGLALACGLAAISQSASGWRLSDSSPDEWELVSGQARITPSDDGIQFSLEPNSQCAFALITHPLWIERFSQFDAEYTVSGSGAGTAASLSLQSLQIGIEPYEDALSEASFSLPLNDESASFVVPPSLAGHPADRIVLSLTSGAAPLRFRLNELAIVDPNDAWRINLPQGIEAREAMPEAFIGLPLDEENALLTPPDDSALPERFTLIDVLGNGVSFEEIARHRVAVTPFSASGEIVIDASASGSELYLLAACDLVGDELHSGYEPRREIDSPDQTIVVKEYEDGSVERSFPCSVTRMRNSITNGEWDAYAVPLDETRTLKRIRIIERMSYGRLFLAAAMVNTDEPLQERYANAEDPFIPSLSYVVPPPGDEASATMDASGRLRIANSFYEIELETRGALWLSSIGNRVQASEYLQRKSPLFSLIANGLLSPNEDWRVASCEVNRATVSIDLLHRDPAMPLEAQLTLAPERGDALAMRMALSNRGSSPIPLRLLFPSVRGAQISERPGDDVYFIPAERTAWGRGDVDINIAHSGAMPLQWMSIYSLERACGLALHTRDLELTPRRFRYQHSRAGGNLGIEYGGSSDDGAMLLGPGETLLTPWSLVQVHVGDWHRAFDRHRDWLVSLDGKQRENPMSDAFLIWREYPVSGSGDLFDRERNAYQFDPLIERLRDEFGGVDAIELARWRHEPVSSSIADLSEIERGSEVNLRRNIEDAARRRILTSLTFDPSWPILADGARRFAEPRSLPGEAFLPLSSAMAMNPGYGPWQRFFAQSLISTAQRLAAPLICLDRIGAAAPARSRNDHSMLTAIKQVFANVETAPGVYVERAPSDVSLRHVDGALSYAISGGAFAAPLPVNLLRFSAPNARSIEKIHPGWKLYAMGPQRAKLAVFHGQGLWLKGRPASWYSRECRAFIRDAYAFLREHSGAFASSDVDPLLPTMQAGLYANRFSSQNRHVITFYNSTPHTISGDLLTLYGERASALRAWRLDGVSASDGLRGAVIKGVIAPGDVAAVVIDRSRNEMPRGSE